MSLFSEKYEQASEQLLFVIYCVHLLPYFGSASNWILYGLLNTQLQMKHDNTNDEHLSMMTVTNNTNGRIITDNEM